MKYYVIENNQIYIAETPEALGRYYNTEIAILPEDYNSQKYIVVDNKLILNPDWDEIELNNAKQAKTAENDSVRDAALNQGVEYKGVLFDSDTDQKVNLMATVEMLPEGATVVWYGMDNQPLECTKEDLYNIGGLITQLHSFCWNKNALIKDEINKATTIEQVNAIVIDYSMEVY